MMDPNSASNRLYLELIVLLVVYIQQGRHVYNADIEFCVDSIGIGSLHKVSFQRIWLGLAILEAQCADCHPLLPSSSPVCFYAMSFTFDVNFKKLCDHGKDFWI